MYYKSSKSSRDVEEEYGFFGGFSDTRHFLQTIIDLATRETAELLKLRHYHFTMIDVNECSIARNLIILMLLQKLSTLDTNFVPAEEILTTLFFVYIAVMIPCVAFNHLHRIIERALSTLKSSSQLTKWIYLQRMDFQVCIQALESWRSRVLKLFTSTDAIEECVWQMQRDDKMEDAGIPVGLNTAKVPTEFMNENKLYRSAVSLIPSEIILRKHDPQMLELLQRHIKQPKVNTSKFK